MQIMIVTTGHKIQNEMWYKTKPASQFSHSEVYNFDLQNIFYSIISKR